jgi:hypothetical protein
MDSGIGGDMARKDIDLNGEDRDQTVQLGENKSDDDVDE